MTRTDLHRKPPIRAATVRERCKKLRKTLHYIELDHAAPIFPAPNPSIVRRYARHMSREDSSHAKAATAGIGDLVPLPEFGSLSETEIVVALLQAAGIPVVEVGRYNPKAHAQKLVPRNRLADA